MVSFISEVFREGSATRHAIVLSLTAGNNVCDESRCRMVWLRV